MSRGSVEPTRETGERRGRFWFIGNNLALDFLNTQMMEGGELVDRHSSPDDLLDWVLAAGIAEAEPRGSFPKSVLADALQLRRTLREAFDQTTAGHAVPDEALEKLNRFLNAPPPMEIRRGEQGLERHTVTDLVARPDVLTWLIADAGARLLTGPMLQAVRRCANKTCILYFADTSRNQARRWCSVKACGNRGKVAAHYVRTRMSRRRQIGNESGGDSSR